MLQYSYKAIKFNNLKIVKSE